LPYEKGKTVNVLEAIKYQWAISVNEKDDPPVYCPLTKIFKYDTE